MNLTDQQRCIIDDIARGDGNLVCDARAGSAKTTTSVLGIQATDPRQDIVCCAFNKRIAATLEEKMPPHARCKTLNALGHGAWIRRVSSGTQVQVNTDKSYRIQKELNLVQVFPDFRRLLALLKSAGVVPSGAKGGGKGLVPDDPTVYKDLIEDEDLDVGICEDPVGAAREGLNKSILMAWRGDIDFDDQLYMTVCFQGQLPKADLVLVDEAQDLSPIQLEMIKMMLKPDARLIAVGDRFQAIYAFRGADSQSIPHIIEEFDAHILPLTTSFRCPQTVVWKAREFVPDIEPWEQAPKGEVRKLDEFSPSEFKPGTCILCRNNAPLISLCFKLISSGVGAAVAGREIGVSLARLIDKVGGNQITEVCDRLIDYAAAETRRLIAKGKSGKAALLDDKVEAIFAISSMLGPNKTAEDLKDTISRMFRDESAVVQLSTIHKAKGLEWPYIYFLDRYLIPSKWARTSEAKQQETNLAYVGVTRAQKVLTFIDSKGYRG